MPQRTELVRALRRITKVVASDRGLDPVLREVMRQLLRMVPADDCSVMLTDAAGKWLIFRDAIGLSKWEVQNIRFRVGEGVAGWVAKFRRPCLIRDARKDPRYVPVAGQRTSIRSLMSVPLMAGGKTIGVLNLTHRSKVNAFRKADIELLLLLADHVSLEIENHRLYELSISDGLTGLYNHRFVLRRTREETAEAKRYRTPLSLLMLDLDHFKRVNDTHGHPAGDRVLMGMAQILREHTREADILSRYGGEEFLLVLPNTGRDGARHIAERLRRQVAATDLGGAALRLRMTVSVGLASYPDDAEDPEALIKAADDALYAAKRAGRDRVMAAGELKAPPKPPRKRSRRLAADSHARRAGR